LELLRHLKELMRRTVIMSKLTLLATANLPRMKSAMTASIGELSRLIFAGVSKHGRSPILKDSEKDQSLRANFDYPSIQLLMASSIADGQVDTSKLETVFVTRMDKVRRYFVEPGDVLIICRGTQVRSAVVPEDESPYAISASLIAIRLDQRVLLPPLLSAYFNHQFVIDNLVKHTASRTDALSITTRTIAEIQINVPPMELQKELAELYDAAIQHRKVSRDLEQQYFQKAYAAVTNPLLVSSEASVA
jgi:hypothetical protein